MAWVAILGSALGCSRRLERSESTSTRAPSSNQVTTPAARPTQLLTDPTSAYTAGLALDDDAIYLLTPHVVHRLVPGKTPQQIPIDNGNLAALTRTDLVYWSAGAIWRIPKSGGKPERVARLDHQPQFFMASGDDVAWLAMPVRDEFVLQTLDDRKIRTLFYHAGRIETATMAGGHIFFVKREGDSSWRIGSVSVHGGELRHTDLQNGPTPAKLAVAGDLFYYDLQSGELRRLSPDLARQEVLSKSLVCSPVAVAAKIYCPNVEGLFALPRQPGAVPVRIFPEPRRITAVAVNASVLAWLADAGADRLSLMTMPLAADEAH